MVNVSDHIGMLDLLHVFEFTLSIGFTLGTHVNSLSDYASIKMVDDLDSSLCVLVKD